ncbi:MAG TPA: L-seryl-tRNA(Sec) selenium transferase, partial [Acidimicrobiia bacterium]|nr:L-seryl-tRNA(Sec) selenium transferase [Acidimicrobiia bacterium]
VGTTNRTRLADYAAVEDPALLLKVHPSNYRVVGFSAEAKVEELAGLGHERGVPFVYDVGSGLLDARVPWLDGPPPPWLEGEPGVRQSLESGADLVLFSGDKLLGGPQAGIIVGRANLIEHLARHPAARALRVDGATTAALAATFAAYLAGRAHELPVWRMAITAPAEIEERAQQVIDSAGITARIVDGASTLGAGSTPGAEIPTRLIELAGAADLHSRLLLHDPPILARRAAGSLVLDLRTVDQIDDAAVASALRDT